MRVLLALVVLATACAAACGGPPAPSDDAGAGTCGDGVVQPPEQCDRGGEPARCPYGATECLGCGPSCTFVLGTTSYCGDDRIDEEAGEVCDGAPCGAGTCSPSCRCESFPGCDPLPLDWAASTASSPTVLPFRDVAAHARASWAVADEGSASSYVAAFDETGALRTAASAPIPSPALRIAGSGARIWLLGSELLTALSLDGGLASLRTLSVPEARDLAPLGAWHLAVASGEGVAIVEARDAAREIARVPLDERVLSVAAGAHLVAGTTSRVVIVDASAPGAPAVRSSVALDHPTSVLAIDGAIAVASEPSTSRTSVIVLDDLDAPRVVSTIELGASGLALAGSRLYVADGSLHEIDLSDPSSPVTLGSRISVADRVVVDRERGLVLTITGTTLVTYRICR